MKDFSLQRLVGILSPRMWQTGPSAAAQSCDCIYVQLLPEAARRPLSKQQFSHLNYFTFSAVKVKYTPLNDADVS